MTSAAVMQWISSVPLGLSICLTGMFGNLLSVYVWHRILKKHLERISSTTIYLITLGVVDTLLLFFFILTNSIPSAFPFVVNNYAYAAFYSYIGFPMMYFLIVSSIWLLVGVTVSRFILVKYPLRAKYLCSANRTIKSIGCIFGCGFVVNMPHFFNFQPKAINGTVIIADTEFAKSGGSTNYEFWIHCMILVLVPWGMIFFCNGSIIWSMKKRVNQFTTTFNISDVKCQERTKEQRQITKLLLTVTASFLILLGWQCVTQCLWMLGKATQENWNIIDKSFAVAKLGIIINSSINWILYCITGSSFRREIRWLYLHHTGVVFPEGNRSNVPRPSHTMSTPAHSTNKETKVSEDSSVP